MTGDALRPDLPPLPDRVRRLPIARGYPVPWFVAWIDGAPDFRVAGTDKFRRAVRERRCWICGDRLGRHLAFVIGPMCGINRTTTEPPCHLECADWSARACPFLARPQAKRRDHEALRLELDAPMVGLPILRNPGVTLIWVTREYRVFDDGRGHPLLRLGEPDRVFWYAEGRAATRAEVSASIVSGLPALQAVAEEQDAQAPGTGAAAALARLAADFERLYPSVGLAGSTVTTAAAAGPGSI